VSEPLPVRIEGSELVLGAGRLAERAKDPASTASVLRSDLSLRSRRALGVRDEVDDAGLARLIAAATNLDEERVDATLTAPVTDDDDLVRVAREIDELNNRLFAVQEIR